MAVFHTFMEVHAGIPNASKAETVFLVVANESLVLLGTVRKFVKVPMMNG